MIKLKTMKEMIKTDKGVLREVAAERTDLLPIKGTSGPPVQISTWKLMSLLLAVGISVLFLSCEKEAPDLYECTDHQNLSFDADILPILKVNCMNGSCHGRFDRYDYVKKYADNDKLLGSIQHKKGYSSMPKDAPKLPDSLIAKISCWIQNGAPEN